MKKEIKIEGMHCSHCTARVEEALGAADGIKRVKTDLKKGLAKIECEADVSDAVIKEKIEALGFDVVSISYF